MTVFSFHPVKTVAAGEGGVVTTNNPQLKERLERLRCHGMVRDAESFTNTELAFDDVGRANPWYYEMPELGWNYRLSDIHAALAESQLSRLQHFVDERRRLAALYDDALSPLAAQVIPIKRSRLCYPAWHLYPVLIEFEQLGLARSDVARQLNLHGIGSQVHYIPVHRQPYYRRKTETFNLPDADSYYRRTLSLPLFVGMTAADVARVAGALSAILGKSDDKTNSSTAAVSYQEALER